MNGRDIERSRGDAERVEHVPSILGAMRCGKTGVVHDVATDGDAIADPLAPQIDHGLPRRTEQEIADVIGDDTVNLLRHVAVERPEASLNVSDPHAAFRRSQRAGERRVRIAIDDYPVGT